MREVGPSEARVLHEVLPDGSHLLLGYDLTEYSSGRKSFLVVLLGISVPVIASVITFIFLGRWLVPVTLG